jgi:hypothetical protein
LGRAKVGKYFKVTKETGRFNGWWTQKDEETGQVGSDDQRFIDFIVS